MFKFLNPIRIMGGWMLAIVVIDVFAIPRLFSSTVGGEQQPLTFLMNSISVLAWGILILSIVTSIIYFRWFQKFWFINVFLLIVSAGYIIKEQQRIPKIDYSYSEKNDSVGGSLIRTRIEYYDAKSEKIRSVSFWKNEMKDSIWTVYSKVGKVIEQQRYKDDKLTE